MAVRPFVRDAIQIARILGIPIRLHWSWFLVLGLITWTLAAGYFPAQLPEARPEQVWLYGLAAALLLFGSVLIHELSHAVVARRTGIPVAGITLHVFGGVAQLEDEPTSPGAEFWMAVVGPLTSYALAGACWLALRLAAPPPGAEALLVYLGVVNALVGTFNLLPGFPLDGGRILRSALWAWRRDLAWATRVASYAGSGFGFALIGWGGLRLATGDPVGGVWVALIGLFLQQAARSSYARVVARRSLARIPVREAMTRAVVTVPAETTVAELVGRYFWTHHVTSFPVVAAHGPGQPILGLVTLDHVRALPRDAWPSTALAKVMVRLDEDLVITPWASCWDALAKLERNTVGRLAVVDAGRLVGYLSIRDVVHLLTLETAGLDGGAPRWRMPARRLDRAA